MGIKSLSSRNFNLVDQPWLPCRTAAGETRLFGLRDALVGSHGIRELRDGSPLVTAALHRLLLAVLHRVFGPADPDAWRALWLAPALPSGPLEEYFARWRGRFDLLDERRPFYQTAGFATEAPSGVNRLAQERARGNNPTLFDHTDDTDPPALSPAEAARLVVAEQAFAVGGGKSATGNTTHAPLVGGAAVLPLGAALRETLLLNLVTYDASERPVPADGDVPFWERDRDGGPPLERMPASPDGYLDLLTWQSRTLRLHVEDLDGRPVVRRVSYAQGRRFAPPPGLFDPAFAIRRSSDGDRAIRLAEDRGVWRDSAALFQFAAADEFLGPLVLRELAERRPDVEGLRPACETAVIGLCTDKAKVNFWRHERLPLPLAYLADAQLVADLKTALALAESVAVVLRSAVRTAARTALSPADPSRADKDRVSQLADSLAPERLYWSRLEEPFRRLLTDLPAADRTERLREWFEAVLRRQAREAFERTAGELDSSARACRAAVEGEAALLRGLAALRFENPYRHIFPQTQEAASAAT